MGRAKDIIVKPISAKDANRIIKSLHYSGKVCPSQLHLGVFLNGKCGGAMQFGQGINKKASLGLIRDTAWNGFFELSRLAFSEWLPRNSESRAISVAMKIIRRQYPSVEWILSYADGAQCGDGSIYRAAGFVLTDIKKNNSMWKMPDGEVVCSLIFNPSFSPRKLGVDNGVKRKYGKMDSSSSQSFLKRIGAAMIPGFQLRYIYFLDPSARDRLTVPIIPFSEIEARGAGMYRGKPRVRSVDGDTTANHAVEGGSIPTRTLKSETLKPRKKSSRKTRK